MSDQQNCHQHSAADSLVTGYAIGMLAAWMFRDSRHPVRDAFSALSAPFVSLVVPALVVVLLQPMQDENGQPPALVSVLHLVVWIVGWCAWASIPTTLDVRADQRWWQHAVAAEVAYRERYRATLAEVATPEEMRLFADEQWDAADRSHMDRGRWQSVLRRWWARNPTVYPSQDQMRAAGYLCRCDPNRGHHCQRSGQRVNLTQVARDGIPVTRTWLQRAFPSLDYQSVAAAPSTRPSGPSS